MGALQPKSLPKSVLFFFFNNSVTKKQTQWLAAIKHFLVAVR